LRVHSVTRGLLNVTEMLGVHNDSVTIHLLSPAGYFVLESFERGAEQLMEYCKSISPK